MKTLAAAVAASGVLLFLVARAPDPDPAARDATGASPPPSAGPDATAGPAGPVGPTPSVNPYAHAGRTAPPGTATASFASLPVPAAAASAGAAARPSGAPAVRPVAPDYRPAHGISPETLTAVVRRVCGLCHNDQLRTANLSLQEFDVAAAPQNAETAEKMIAKLRADMMPPPGIPRPGGDTLLALAETLEALIDEAAAARPDPGRRTFQRLNRAEYERSIRDLLALEIDAGDFLPLDTRSANFDNIADVQIPSPTLLQAYLDAAAEISRLAIGDPHATPSSSTYPVPRLASQTDRVEGAPIGTRGGVSVIHTFPADGEYVFKIALRAIPTGELFGRAAPFDERLEVSIDGARVALLEIDRWLSQADPNGLNLETERLFVRAGPRRVTAAFMATFEGPVNDLIAPIGHSIADTQIGAEHGITNLPHMQNLVVSGPFGATGVSETPSRRRIFTCRPTAPAEARPCAKRIISRLATQAYRRPLADRDLDPLIAFYEDGAAEAGFEAGIRMALHAMLVSPHFIFRLETLPGPVEPGETYRISDIDLASRLSFFVWGAPPDEALIALADQGRLSEPAALEREARRLLADPRSEALATRFAAQWLRLQDLSKVHPDALQYPDFHEQLAHAMRRETELFFHSIVREDRSVLDLFSADYTFINDRLAEHYGIPGVTGPQFRRVRYPDDTRRGLFGHGSVLTLTSHANRTSPVLRGKWVMEVLLGTPPPPPPPGVPDLEETEDAKDGRFLTTRERMEMHRSNAMCRSCHQYIDPIGLALDNFDVTGRWRIREHGMPLDTQGELYDGTPVSTPDELRRALLKRPIPLVRTFAQNLMAYALGRRIEYYDMPAVRAIARQAEANDYRISDFILGVVESDAFRLQRVPDAVAADAGDRGQP